MFCVQKQSNQIHTCFAAASPIEGVLSSSMIDGGYQVHLDPKQQSGINFTIKSGDEAILLIEDDATGCAT